MDAPQHGCYRNFLDSSAAMENNVRADGFSLLEQMYRLRYMSVIDNGDSAVIATIRQAVPYGIFFSKIECANHFHVPEIL